MISLRIALLTISISCITQLYSQREIDLGLLAGASYYLGDINHSTQFYNPQFAGGVIFRYNLNPRYVIKTSVSYVPLAATEVGSPDFFQNSRGASFSNILADFGLQFEFNFLPYTFVGRKVGFSPFLSAGVGTSFAFYAEMEKNFWATLPLGVGLKFTFGKKWSAGWEWNFRKLFDDKIDGLVNPGEAMYSSMFHNVDWYSYSGILVAYKLFDVDNDCPAYVQ